MMHPVLKRIIRRPAGLVLGALPARALPLKTLRRLPASQVRASAMALIDYALTTRPRYFAAAPTRYGFKLSGSTTDIIQRWVYLFGVWEPDISKWMAGHLRRGDVVIDVGANIGYYSLLASRRVGPTGRVIAFEPVPSISQSLATNLKLNGVSNVEIIRCIASDRTGDAEIFRSQGNNLGASSTHFQDGFESEGLVRQVRGADVVDQNLWCRVRAIKVDTEGDEFRVLRGFKPLLEKMPKGGAVVVEVTPDLLRERGETAQELTTFMKDLNFSAFRIYNEYSTRHYALDSPRSPEPMTHHPNAPTDVLFLKMLE